jgi:hypothetical protein
MLGILASKAKHQQGYIQHLYKQSQYDVETMSPDYLTK